MAPAPSTGDVHRVTAVAGHHLPLRFVLHAVRLAGDARGTAAMLRFLLGLAAQAALFAALILGPAWLFTGTPDWPRGRLVLAILVAVSAVGGLFFLRTDPALVSERASVTPPRTVGDAVASGVIAASVVLWFVVAAWDVHHLRLPGLDPGLTIWIGLAVFLTGVGVIVWTFRVNSFAITIVEVQSEREQYV